MFVLSPFMRKKLFLIMALVQILGSSAAFTQDTDSTKIVACFPGLDLIFLDYGIKDPNKPTRFVQAIHRSTGLIDYGLSYPISNSNDAPVRAPIYDRVREKLIVFTYENIFDHLDEPAQYRHRVRVIDLEDQTMTLHDASSWEAHEI